MGTRHPHTRLILVRHGQARSDDGTYDWNTPLSDLGRRQAEAVADWLVAGMPPSAIYTSPWIRAVETAKPLSDRLGVKPVVEPRLAEFDIGSLSLEQVQARPDLTLWRPDQSGVPGGETLAEFSARVAAACDGIVGLYPGGRAAVFAHSGTIDAALRWALGMAADSPWQHDFDLPNGSITELEFWPRGRVQGGAPRYAAIGRIGDTTHLGDLSSDL